MKWQNRTWKQIVFFFHNMPLTKKTQNRQRKTLYHDVLKHLILWTCLHLTPTFNVIILRFLVNGVINFPWVPHIPIATILRTHTGVAHNAFEVEVKIFLFVNIYSTDYRVATPKPQSTVSEWVVCQQKETSQMGVCRKLRRPGGV